MNRLDELMDGYAAQKDTAFRASATLSVDANPDEVARQRRIASILGQPVEAVQALPKDAEREAKIRQLDQQTAQTPTLRQQFTNEDFAKLAHDDADNLSGFERILRAPWKMVQSVAAGIPSLASGLYGAAAAPFEMASQYIGQPLAGRLLPEDIFGKVGAGLRAASTNLKGYAERVADVPTNAGLVERSVASGFQSLGQNIPALGAAVATGNPAIAIGGLSLSAGGSSYAKAREKGLTPTQSFAYGATDAAVEFATEKLPVSLLLKDLKAGSSLWKTVGHQLATEIPGEQAATALQDLNEWAVLNPDKPFSSYLAERPSAMAQTLIATVIGTGGNIAVMKAVDNVLTSAEERAARAQRAEDGARVLEQLGEYAKASRVLERDPTVVEDFVQKVAEDTGADTLFVSAQALMQSGLAEQVAELLPSVAAQLPTAVETDLNLTIAIPVGEYVANVAKTDMDAPLRELVRFDPNGFSREEAKAYMQSHAAELQAEVERTLGQTIQHEDFKASQERVKQAVLDELTKRAARFTPDVNEVYATLIAARTAVRAAQLGMTPEQFFEQQRLRVQAEGVPGAEALQQGPFGPQLTEFRGDYAGALAKLREMKTGEAIGVLNHPDIGDIDLPYGEEGTGESDGYGLAKLLKWHPDVVDQLPQILADMHVTSRSKNRVRLESEKYRAAVRLTWDDEAKHWLLTAFRKEGGGGATRTDTSALAGKDGTTSLADASDSIVDEKLGRFYQSTGVSDRDLVVTHNLSAGNLLHALKMGGIPVPSLAITRAANPLTSFGEITLIGDKDLADPKGYAKAKVFAADIYSPRYPQVALQFTPNMRARAEAQLRAGMDATDTPYIDWSEVERNGSRELERNAPFLWTFLTSRGIEPNVKRVQPVPPRAELMPFVDSDKDVFDLTRDPDFVDMAWGVYGKQMVDANGGDVTAAEAEIAVARKLSAERGIFYFARDLANTVERYRRELRDSGKVDRDATRLAMENQVRAAELTQELEAAARQFIESIGPNERIFTGFTYAGRKRYIPHTLENVVKILKKELRGGENFNYGVRSLRAKFTPQFRTIEQIRKAKNRLVSKADFERIEAEIDEQFWDAARAINGDLSGDTAVAIMEDAAKMGVQRAAKGYGYDVAEDDAMKVAEFLTRLRELPAEYFEAKILRDVDLSEFRGAVVPQGVDPQVIAALESRGVRDIRYYERHNEADRAAKVGEFQHLFFQEARGSFVPSQNLITLLKDADLSTFLHETGHYFFENDIALAAELVGKPELTAGEQQILQDVSTLLTEMGVAGPVEQQIATWYSLDFEEKRAYHERVAESFERYLFEGKAPSIELEHYFQRFRAFLTAVYKTIKDFIARNPEAGKLSDEVRGVFDRMIATSEQIQLAEQARSMLPLFETADQAGMTVEEFAAYQSLSVQHSNDAIQELQGRTLRDLAWTRRAHGREVKRLQKEAESRRREIRMDVRAEVMSQPLYRAWQFLTGKIGKDDKLTDWKPPKSDPDRVVPEIDSMFAAIAKLGGLKRSAVEAEWGFDPKQASPMPGFGKYLLRREKGLSIDAMGELLAQYGYLSTDENGKYDVAEFEERFDAELRGDEQYSISYDYAAARGPERAGEQYLVENLGSGRLELGELQRMGLPEEIIAHLTALGMTAKTGLNPDIVADMFPPFTSGDELVRTLAAADTPEDAIEGLTDKAMLERYGDLATPEAIERAADKAIQNEARARMVAAEANALIKALNERRSAGKDRNGRPLTRAILPEAARNFAQQLISRLRIRDIRPGQYAAAQERAAREAAAAQKAGKIEIAVAEKRNELVQTYAARAAYDAQDEVEKGLRYLRRFSAPGKMPADHYQRILALLDKFDLRPRTNRQADAQERFATWVKGQLANGEIPPNFEVLLSADARRRLDTELQARDPDGNLIYADEEAQAELIAQFLDAAPVRNVRDITLEEFRGLITAVKQIEHIGRRTQKVLTDRKNRLFADVVQTIRDNLFEVAGRAGRKSRDVRSANSAAGRLAELGRGHFFSHVKAAALIEIIDGKQGGPLWEALMLSANRAADAETLDIAQARDQVMALLKPLKDMGAITDKATYFPSIDRSLNRQARIAMAMNVGNESNLQRLLGGEGWTVEQIQPVLATLTAADWQFVQSMWDTYEMYKPQWVAVYREMNGTEPVMVQPQSFNVTTADGQTITLRGGYAPVIYDPRGSGKAQSFADEKAAKETMRAARVAATVNKSFTKERVDEVKGRPLMLSLDALINGVQDTIHYVHWAPWILDANRLVRALDAPIRQHYGAEAVKALRDWVADTATGVQAPRDAAERGIAFFAKNISFTALAFNLLNAVQQVTGYSSSIVTLSRGEGAKAGYVWMARGVAHIAKGGTAAYREMLDKSPFMRKRASTMIRDLNDVAQTIQDQSKFAEMTDRYGYALTQAAQVMVDSPTWWGAYHKAVATQGGIVAQGDGTIDDSRAVELADQAVIDSQGSGQRKDLARYERATGAMRLLSGFMSYMNTMANQNYRTLRSDDGWFKKAHDLALINIVPVVMMILLKEGLTPGGGDDEDFWKKLATEEIAYLFGQMIGLREIAQIGAAFFGERAGEYGGPVGLRWVKDVLALAKQVGQGEADLALLKSGVTVIADIFRLPGVQINRMLTGASALEEGETDNPAALVMGVQK